MAEQQWDPGGIGFELFMQQHAPAFEMANAVDDALWSRAALNPTLKERLRITSAETIGCNTCATYRTALSGRLLVDEEEDLSPQDKKRLEVITRFVREVCENRASVSDALLDDVVKEFSPPEMADLIFSMGWFIGMQYVGKLMRWDDACPVPKVREAIEDARAEWDAKV